MRTLLLLSATLLGWTTDSALAQTTSAAGASCIETRRQRCPTSADVLARANEQARRTSIAGGFEEARQVHVYAAGAIYELVTIAGRVSVLLLEAGEAITAIAAGDTTRWLVSEVGAELDGEGRAVVLVKPLAADVETNIVIVTDRRTYLVEARSTGGRAYAAEMSWTYPSAAVEAAASRRATFDDYRIRVVRGRRPVWTPIAVRDDGRRTTIEFATDVAAADLPPLFVVTSEGAELVNYRVDGARYVVDRVFDRAELRLGVRAPTIVRIERIGSEPRPLRRRSRR